MSKHQSAMNCWDGTQAYVKMLCLRLRNYSLYMLEEGCHAITSTRFHEHVTFDEVFVFLTLQFSTLWSLRLSAPY